MALMSRNNFLRVTHNDIPFLIFSKKELKRMLDYSEMSQDNIVLVHDDNSIGTVYPNCKKKTLRFS